MISIDTTLLIRLLTNDDKAEAKYAAKLIEKNNIFISKSVLLETEWILRHTYKIEPDLVHNAFEMLLGLPNIKVEDPTCIIKAMSWYGQDFDFSDAIHLASSESANKFATLDKSLIKRAKKINANLITK